MTPPSAPRFLGDRISAARRARGMTQADLAETAGLSQPTISNLERGLVADPSMGTVAAIAEALRLPLEALVGEDEQTFWSALTADSEEGDEPAVDEDRTITVWRKFLDSALRSSASDIHLTPKGDRSYTVRFRVHGQLETAMIHLEERWADRWTAHLVDRARCATESTLQPQFGRFTDEAAGQKIQLQVVSLPTASGQRDVTIRLMRDSTLSLDELGFSPESMRQLTDAIAAPYGLVLVSGPTGSGRTTTIHAALKHLAAMERQVVQINAGDEPDAPGVVTVHTNVPPASLGMRETLQSVLRADPDVISVGEVIDPKTVSAAFEAAETGHLVFAQISPMSAISTLLRLRENGVPGYAIAESLAAIVSQRLVRTLCHRCRVQRDNGLYTAAGCVHCNKRGYTGRIAVAEVLAITDAMRRTLRTEPDNREVIREACRDIHGTIAEQAKRLAEEGVISAEEAARVAR